MINQIVIKEMLTKHGFEIAIAENGRQAIEMLRSDPDRYSLVLMDCQMPELDGYTAAGQIREIEAGGTTFGGSERPIPIVALTANAMTSTENAASTRKWYAPNINPTKLFLSSPNRFAAQSYPTQLRDTRDHQSIWW